MTPPVIRLAVAADREQVLALVPRLRAFGEAVLRTPNQLDAGETRALNQHFDSPPKDRHLWVAEGRDGKVIGAALGATEKDYFTRESHGHLSILMVAEEAAGTGVGSALMETAERWARESGFRFLTLNVFAANESARRFYRKGQFQEDYVRYIKPL